MKKHNTHINTSVFESNRISKLQIHPLQSWSHQWWLISSCRKSAAKKEGSDDEEVEKKVKTKDGDDDSDSENDGQRKVREEMDDMVRKVRFNLENLGLVDLLVADVKVELVF